MSTTAEKPTQGIYARQAELHQPRPADCVLNPAIKDATGVSQWVQVLSVCSSAAAKRSSATKNTVSNL